ncbi:hypothetical protein [Nocardia sp. AG03]|uniref:hypothetical protein n=1 Tax=Nocardia sp. AG03 TaxID=3025312 RepID=UPI0024186578|nr:hypothetical protein [Nocardia sp. AG03]
MKTRTERLTSCTLAVAAGIATAVLGTSGIATADSSGAGIFGPYASQYGCGMIRSMDVGQYPDTYFGDCFEVPGEGWYYIGT